MERILLILEGEGGLRALREVLEGYELLESEEALGEVFDLGVLDVGSLERLASRVRERREGERPLFLPFLLVVARGGEVPARFLGEVVDEVVFFPL